MVKGSAKLLIACLLMVGCAGEFSADDALSSISQQSEFQESFCAPLHIGREVLTAENHKDPKAFVDAKYGILLKSGLVRADVGEKNSWRTLLNVTLTDQGSKMVNEKRTTQHLDATGEDHVFYVASCRLVPEKIVSVDTLHADTMRVTYSIVERELTPFGQFLGFVDGRAHNHSRTFVRGNFSWELLPL